MAWSFPPECSAPSRKKPDSMFLFETHLSTARKSRGLDGTKLAGKGFRKESDDCERENLTLQFAEPELRGTRRSHSYFRVAGPKRVMQIQCSSGKHRFLKSGLVSQIHKREITHGRLLPS